MKAGDFDFLLLSLPDNDNYSHRHGPEASVESIAKADHCFAKLVEAAGGMEAFLDEPRADPARRPRPDAGRPGPAAGGAARPRVGRCCSPPTIRPERAQLAVSPTGRAAHVYLLPGEGTRAEHGEVGTRLAETEGVDLVCWLEDAAARRCSEPGVGMPPGDGVRAVVERGGEQLRFRPATRSPTCAAARWDLEGDPAALDGRRGGRSPAQRGVPGPACPRLRGADGAPRRRLHRLAGARL